MPVLALGSERGFLVLLVAAWSVLLPFTGSKVMVHSFGLDVVPRINWLHPPDNSAFPQSYLLQTGWPCCLHPLPSSNGLSQASCGGAVPYGLSCRCPALSPLHAGHGLPTSTPESQLREPGPAACHSYPSTSPTPPAEAKARRGSSPLLPHSFSHGSPCSHP